MEGSRISRKGFLSGLTMLAVSGCAPTRREVKASVQPSDSTPPDFREVERLETGLKWPRGIACSPTSLWIAGDMEVRRYRGTKLEETFEYGDAIQAVAVGPDAKAYAATSDRVIPIRGDSWPSLGPRARIVSLAVSTDRVAAADAGNRAVVVYDREGRFIRSIEGFVVPSPYFGVAYAPNGDLIVSNPGRHCVERRSSDGMLIECLGEQGQEIDGFCGCCNPGPIALTSRGDIVTSEKGIPRVKILGNNGSFQSLVSTDFDSTAVGLAVAVDGDRVLVLDPGEGVVRTFEQA